ncbi:phage terminase small subunit [Aliivibrio sifiae]|uniref:Terminase n=1 Tax=Aliivibrio sifiae TaxID=566293 RepID=A0A2S7XHR4_9GAMM|nr:phage terminase small subunit [Aliivibrio sifiae]PQJ93143.1 terminase [Aliivibrio sifiae]GLR75979.1 terminase [Aliivibrio sifiae]
MASPLAKQRQAILAKETPSMLVSSLEPKSLHLLLIELENDMAVLKSINRIEDKITHKRDVLIPKYRPSIEDYLANKETYDNPLFSQMIIWLFDIEELDTAIEWCDKAIELGVTSPFNRDLATFCAGHVLEWTHKMSNMGHSIDPYFSQTFKKVREKWRLSERLTCQYFKFAGLFLLRDKDGHPRASSVGDVETLEKAHALLTEADNIYGKAKVKTVLDNINQRIRALKEGVNL